MKREYYDIVEDMLRAIDETKEFTAGYSFEDFTIDQKTINAVIRSLEVLGEAAKKLPAEIREQAPEIPWKYMAGMRDKLIHDYFGVDVSIIWSVIHDELPDVRPQIEHLLNKMPRG